MASVTAVAEAVSVIAAAEADSPVVVSAAVIAVDSEVASEEATEVDSEVEEVATEQPSFDEIHSIDSTAIVVNKLINIDIYIDASLFIQRFTKT